MSDKHIPKFSLGYVVKLTVSNMRKAVDNSISIASARISDFEAGSDKWQEVLDTIYVLHQLKKLVDEFVIHNEQLFKNREK